MTQSFVSAFVQAWLLGIIALLIGRFVGPGEKILPLSLAGKVLLYVEVWAVTFVAQLALTYLGALLEVTQATSESLLGFIAPVAIGSVFAHLRLRAQASLPHRIV